MTVQKIKKYKRFSFANFTSILDKYKYDLKLGDIVAGVIFSKERNGYLINIGDHNSAFLPNEETSNITQQTTCLNTIQEFFIVSYDVHSTFLILSSRRLEYIRTWKRIKQIYVEESILYATVSGENSGGLLINFDGVSGFLPNSHIVNPSFKATMINTIIPVQFLLLDDTTNQIIVSHRKAVVSLSNLILGKKMNAKIVKITTYGILLKIHNIQALLHSSEILHPYKFEVKQYLRITIIHVNLQQGRVSVSVPNYYIY